MKMQCENKENKFPKKSPEVILVQDSDEDEGIDKSTNVRKKRAFYGVKKFHSWLESTGTSCPLESISAEELADVLCKFYSQVNKTKDNRPVAPNTFKPIRTILQHYISGPPYNRDIDITEKKGPFERANQVFEARCKELCDMFASTQHPSVMTMEAADKEKLARYFSAWSKEPQVLLDACWYHVCSTFGQRGREMWVSMTKSTFQLHTDSNGVQYVSMPDDCRHAKSHPKYMWGVAVEVLKFYCIKLNPDERRFWQHPLVNAAGEGQWFSRPYGKNRICLMMQQISKHAGLSKAYPEWSLHTGCVCSNKHRLRVSHKPTDAAKALKQLVHGASYVGRPMATTVSVNLARMPTLDMTCSEEPTGEKPLCKVGPAVHIPTRDIHTFLRKAISNSATNAVSASTNTTNADTSYTTTANIKREDKDHTAPTDVHAISNTTNINVSNVAASVNIKKEHKDPADPTTISGTNTVATYAGIDSIKIEPNTINADSTNANATNTNSTNVNSTKANLTNANSTNANSTNVISTNANSTNANAVSTVPTTASTKTTASEYTTLNHTVRMVDKQCRATLKRLSNDAIAKALEVKKRKHCYMKVDRSKKKISVMHTHKAGDKNCSLRKSQIPGNVCAPRDKDGKENKQVARTSKVMLIRRNDNGKELAAPLGPMKPFRIDTNAIGYDLLSKLNSTSAAEKNPHLLSSLAAAQKGHEAQLVIPNGIKLSEMFPETQTKITPSNMSSTKVQAKHASKSASKLSHGANNASPAAETVSRALLNTSGGSSKPPSASSNTKTSSDGSQVANTASHSPNNLSPIVDLSNNTALSGSHRNGVDTPKWSSNLKLDIADNGAIDLPSNLGPGTVLNVDVPRKNMHHTIIVNGSLTNCIINFNM